jgi:hypothetical protein
MLPNRVIPGEFLIVHYLSMVQDIPVLGTHFLSIESNYLCSLGCLRTLVSSFVYGILFMRFSITINSNMIVKGKGMVC